MSGCLIAALVILTLLLLFFWPAGRARFRNVLIRDLRRHLEFLLKVTRDGSFLILEDGKSSRFLQFRKATDNKGGGFLVLDFPDAPWSRCYFEGIARALTDHGVNFTMVETESLECPRFLEVQNIVSAEEAHEIAKILFRELGFAEDAKVNVLLHASGVERVGRSVKG
ncbi:hypothetical protein EG19_09390 [Thermoanaerobaculum aquaticum]|uniref:Uncharacterized protein n=1 Tax=Thermoanaerobaculum aquaticum TaxID=1312852 RepID=A0A062XXN9_9BACT|nr:hypothetical protein [Thermoanaerobaculum aquaticum]KDA52861.1 hypothetical protein EG19_09390 [Thermoanaerobaculum aquaticum]